MTPFVRTFAILAVCGGSAAAGSAEKSQRPALSRPVSLHFNAPAGAYQHFLRATPCGATRFHTKIVIDQVYLDPSKKWWPAEQIVVNPQAVDNGTVASLFIEPFSPRMLIELRKASRGKWADKIIFSSPATLGKDIDAAFSWTPDGVLSITLDGSQKHSVTLGAPVRLLNFTVSGARASFNAVQFEVPDARGCATPRNTI